LRAIGDFPAEGDKGKEFFSLVEGGWGLEKWEQFWAAMGRAAYLAEIEAFRE